RASRAGPSRRFPRRRPGAAEVCAGRACPRAVGGNPHDRQGADRARGGMATVARLRDPATVARSDGRNRRPRPAWETQQLKGHPMTLLSTHIPSPVGPLLLVASETHLRAIWFSTPRQPLPRDIALNEGENGVIRKTRSQLDEYFGGSRRTFDLPLRPVGTAFQCEVWSMLEKIPYGETWSYGDVA